MLADALPSFVQSLNPAHTTLGSTLIALIPIVLLLVLLPVLRMSAWQAVIIGSIVTIVLAVTVWGAPVGGTLGAWGVGTYRQNDSVDVRYTTADGRPAVAEGLELTSDDAA